MEKGEFTPNNHLRSDSWIITFKLSNNSTTALIICVSPLYPCELMLEQSEDISRSAVMKRRGCKPVSIRDIHFLLGYLVFEPGASALRPPFIFSRRTFTNVGWISPQSKYQKVVDQGLNGAQPQQRPVEDVTILPHRRLMSSTFLTALIDTSFEVYCL